MRFRKSSNFTAKRRLWCRANCCAPPPNTVARICNSIILSDATSFDRFPVEPRFEVNYHLVSIPNKAKIRLRTRVSGADPVVDSMVPVWPGAGWLEREIYDLMGIRFNGHPDLRRILLPDDWEGHPLRRDYPTEGFRDVPATFLPGFKK